MEPSVLFKQRNRLSATEVSVLMRACVRRWAYEHAACVCVLPLFQPRQANSSTTPAPMQTSTAADRNIFYWPTLHLKTRLADTCTANFHKSQLASRSNPYATFLVRALPTPTACVLPRSARWSMSRSSASRGEPRAAENRALTQSLSDS